MHELYRSEWKFIMLGFPCSYIFYIGKAILMHLKQIASVRIMWGEAGCCDFPPIFLAPKLFMLSPGAAHLTIAAVTRNRSLLKLL